jgi:hypothetical protein
VADVDTRPLFCDGHRKRIGKSGVVDNVAFATQSRQLAARENGLRACQHTRAPQGCNNGFNHGFTNGFTNGSDASGGGGSGGGADANTLTNPKGKARRTAKGAAGKSHSARESHRLARSIAAGCTHQQPTP